MKRKILLSLFLAAGVLLCGCNTGNSTDQKADNGNERTLSEDPYFSEEQPSDSGKTQDNLTAARIYRSQAAELSADSYLKLFSSAPQCDKITVAERKMERNEYTAEGESGTVVYIDGQLSQAGYHTNKGFKIIAVEQGSGDIDQETEFDFISRKELSQKLSDAVRDLVGIEVEMKIGAVKAEQYSEDVKSHITAAAELGSGEENADDYGSPEDFYLISFTQAIDGIPFEECFGYAVYTSAGIEFLDVNNPIKAVSEEPAGSEFMTLDKARELIKDKYDLLLLDEPVSFTDEKLIYICRDELLTPAWKFTSDKGTEEYYDAYTGREIVWGALGEGA